MNLQPVKSGNTVPFLDKEQQKSTKNTQKNVNKWYFLATLAEFFENHNFFKKSVVRNEICNKFYHLQLKKQKNFINQALTSVSCISAYIGMEGTESKIQH